MISNKRNADRIKHGNVSPYNAVEIRLGHASRLSVTRARCCLRICSLLGRRHAAGTDAVGAGSRS